MKDIKIIKSNRKLSHTRFIIECTKDLYMHHVNELNDDVDYKYRFKHKHYMVPKDRLTYIITYKNKFIGIFSVIKYYGMNYIWRFIIKEQYRSQGIGREVLKYIINNMYSNRHLNVLVYKANTKAINLYKSLGFTESEVYKPEKEVSLILFRKEDEENTSEN